MKIKLSLLAFLLLPSMVSAYSCGGYNNFVLTLTSTETPQNDPMIDNVLCYASNNIFRTFLYSHNPDILRSTNYYGVSSCPSNTVANSNGICHTACSGSAVFSEYSNSCVVPSLSSYDNDPAGCHSHNGLISADGHCLSHNDFMISLFTNPNSIVGTGLMVNGMLLIQGAGVGATLVGAVGLGAGGAIIGGLGVAAIGAGVVLTGKGLLEAYFANDVPSAAPVPDVTNSDDGRFKVTVLPNGDTAVAKTDTTTGKVQSVDFIPNPVVEQMKQNARYLKGGDLYNPAQPMAESAPPINPTGIKSTTFDHSTNTATTKTVQSDGTTVTQTTPFTSSTNSDGSVTSTPTNTTVAPVVTGTTQSTSENPNWNVFNTTNVYNTTTSSTGDTTADSLLNSSMPGYDFGTNNGLNELQSHNIDNMVLNTDSLRTNISNQISASTTLLNDTKALFDGSFETPQFGPGQCGTGMQIDIWGKHIDLCQIITSFISPLQPLFSFITTVALMALAIVIFLGGL